MTEIAFRAGFGSVRRFNAAFSDLYGRSPSSLRATSRGREWTEASARQPLGRPSPRKTPMSKRARNSRKGNKAQPRPQANA